MSPEIIDTHCHLTFKDMAPLQDQVIHRARQAGVTRMITIVCCAEELPAALELQSRHPDAVRVAAGIHPHQAGTAGAADVDVIAEAWRAAQLIAAGEMGLDFHYDFCPRHVQHDVFKRQLERVRPLGLPVIIHSREAHADTVSTLVAHGFDRQPVVFHCFSGTPDEAAEIRSHGWRTSFTGIITFKNADAPRQACAETPLGQLMFETDAPYLSPAPVRHVRPNEPAHVAHTLRFAAELHHQKFSDLAAATTRNAVSFFGWR
jgi:TatD DNase family protein